MVTDLRGRCFSLPPRRPSSPGRPRRRASSSSTCYTRPSSTLLSILGTLAAFSSNVNASPAPPSFLCPSLDTEHTPVAAIHHSPSPNPEEIFVHSSDPTGRVAGIVRSIPDRYQVDDDGRWRRVDEYTLYGSTVCPSCGEPSSGVPAVDDEIQGANASSPPSSTPSPSYDIRDSLPPGWKAQSNSSGSRTTLILVLSLVLAFLICFVIIGLVFWRKNKRRSHRQDDVEMKARRRRRDIPGDEDREIMVQRELKAKQKIWARATARWKANVRYTARQRRGKRIVSTSRVTSRNSIVSLDQTASRACSPAPSPSRPLSRRSSIESLYSNSPADAAIDFDHASGQQAEQVPPPPASPATSSHGLPHSSPPAYHQRMIRHQNSKSTEVFPDDPVPSSSSSFHVEQPPSPGESSEPIDTSSHMSLHLSSIPAAHVATDDKSLLARLAELASSPPSSEEYIRSEAQPSMPQAPVWHDEEFEDFPCDPGGSSSIHMSRPSTPAPLFPPPPSKGKMAAYDYPYSFEDITMEPEAGPSAPPFDDTPSSPPTDSIDLTPSAPPLLDYVEFRPSTPPPDWGPDDQPPSLRQEDRDHCTEIGMMPADIRPQTDILVPESDTLTMPVEGPISSDGTPPGYHP